MQKSEMRKLTSHEHIHIATSVSRARAAGFSLIEMLAVIVLIGIVAGIVVQQVGKNVDKGKYGAGKAQVQALAGKIEGLRARQRLAAGAPRRSDHQARQRGELDGPVREGIAISRIRSAMRSSTRRPASTATSTSSSSARTARPAAMA